MGMAVSEWSESAQWISDFMTTSSMDTFEAHNTTDSVAIVFASIEANVELDKGASSVET